MNKKGILKITGIIFSLIIIASVFLPYNKVNNSPLFQLSNTKELLLPILIILFGIASIVLYITNHYSEFPLATSGAVLFFVVIEAIYAISNKTLGDFGIGYFVLVAGSVLLFLNTVILLIGKIKGDKKVEQPVQTSETVGDSIDKLYAIGENQNDTVNTANTNVIAPSQEIQPIQPLEPIQPVQELQPIQPLTAVEPVQDLQPIQPLTAVEPVQPIQEVQSVSTVEPVQPVQDLSPIQELKPISDSVQSNVVSNPLPELQFEQMQEVKEPIKPIYEEPKEVRPEDNPALKSLLEPSEPQVSVESNPALQQFNQPQQVNPVLQQFDQPQQVNPVLQQFDQPQSFLSQPSTQPTSSTPQQNVDTGVGMSIFDNH